MFCMKRVLCINISRRDFNHQFYPQKFWVKSELTPVFLSKNLSLEHKSRQIFIHDKSTHLEQTLNFPENAYIFNWSLFSGMNIVKLGCRCVTLWFFNLPIAETLIFSLKFDQFDLGGVTAPSGGRGDGDRSEDADSKTLFDHRQVWIISTSPAVEADTKVSFILQRIH